MMTLLPTPTPHVAILLCTHKGEGFLHAQLASYLAQTHTNWSLWASDDASTDATWAILEAFCAAHPERLIYLRRGPAQGFVRNFLSLACDASIAADYFAYSDQDDIWFDDKLARAVAALAVLPAEKPLLYGARSEFIDVDGATLGTSYAYGAPSFANALTQCMVGGNTMLFNQATRKLLQQAGPQSAVASHDWFTYQLVTGVGGYMAYDVAPVIGYRQYRGAMSGSNRGLKPSLIRIMKLLGGTYRDWNALNVATLHRLRALLTPENQVRLERFRKSRISILPVRLWMLWRSGAKRQHLLGNLGMVFAAVIRRF
jgi:glycosyltransferase involved in cell wall biosynthesis